MVQSTNYGNAEEWMARGDAHFAAIGRVTEAWAALELRIDMLSWDLAGLDERMGAVFTAQIQGGVRKMMTAVMLAGLLDPADALVSDLQALANRLSKPQGQRNRTVHDSWIMGEEGQDPQRLEVSVRNGLRLEIVTQTTQDLLDLAFEIDDFWGELIPLFDRARALRLASLDR